MINAVDSSVLMAIEKGEPGHQDWLYLLNDALDEGPLVVCDVVVAEFYGVVLDEWRVFNFLNNLGIFHVPASRRAVCFAGQIFRDYRDRGGPRRHLLPDFLVAAHAAVDCGRLAAADRGYVRDWFPRLPLLCV